MSELHILSLGAGVQSTTVYLLAMEGAFHLDAAVFADTGEEPKAVYEHLKWLQSLNNPTIYVRSKGKLGDDLMRPTYVQSAMFGKKTRFASVPFYTQNPDGELGLTRRQCSKEYKVEVVERCIRRDILGLKPRQRIPKSIAIHQYFGISLDEARRTIGIKKRCERPHFPLIERGWTRADCQRYLAAHVPHEVPRSSCVFCPYHNDAEWLAVKSVPEDWARAVEVDSGVRLDGARAAKDLNGALYAHRTCLPLEQVQFRHERQFNMFTTECEGMCGN